MLPFASTQVQVPMADLGLCEKGPHREGEELKKTEAKKVESG